MRNPFRRRWTAPAEMVGVAESNYYTDVGAHYAHITANGETVWEGTFVGSTAPFNVEWRGTAIPTERRMKRTARRLLRQVRRRYRR